MAITVAGGPGLAALARRTSRTRTKTSPESGPRWFSAPRRSEPGRDTRDWRNLDRDPASKLVRVAQRSSSAATVPVSQPPPAPESTCCGVGSTGNHPPFSAL